jgi:transcriptional antiterminator NusG
VAHKWYIVHTYSGFENKVKVALEEQVKSLGKTDLISEVLVQTEKVRTSQGNRLPPKFTGYVLIKMELNDETWHLVNTSYRICRGESRRLSDEEAEKSSPRWPKERSAQTEILLKGKRNPVVGTFANFNGWKKSSRKREN